jgi:NTE family protein
VFFNNFNSKKSNTGEWPGKLNIKADHVMASGALPPAFPPISIDDGKDAKLYWDGGVSTNTPIEALEEDLTGDFTKDTLVFLINLWDRKGNEPQSLDEVLWRQKSIQYGSRKEAAESVVRNYENLARNYELEIALNLKPTHFKAQPKRLEVCQVMLETDVGDAQFSFGDADFSRATFEKMRVQGCKDMQNAIKKPKPVAGLRGTYATLYRYGTKGKHNVTDKYVHF